MALVNGGYLHYTDMNKYKKVFSETTQKKKKMARVLSKIQVRIQGPSWPPCLHSSDFKYKAISTKLGQIMYDHRYYTWLTFWRANVK